MTSQTKKRTVLLTGISGFIGLHCAKQLLNQGFEVRGTVRSANKEKAVRDALEADSVDTKNLCIIELDLLSDKGWDAAASGCDFVMHVASPYAMANPKDENDMIVPAVEGTLRAIRAANKAGVKRVVLTSSIAAMMGNMKTGTFGPDDWTDPYSSQINTYFKSKTLAEKAAWDFIANQSTENEMQLVSINPGVVLGPPLGTDITGQSMASVDKMLRGKMPLLPEIYVPMIDVRDVALLHVKALTLPDAANLRILASTAKPGSYIEAAQILKNAGYKGPSTRVAPDFLLRFISLFDSEVKGTVGMLGVNLSGDNSKTCELFNWQPIPLEQCILDTASAWKAITS